MKTLTLTKTFLLSILIIILSACSNETQIKAWQLIDEGALIVDVRTKGEFKSGHLPNAKLIPINQVKSRLSEFGNNKNRPIVVYCQSGSRSGAAEQILKSAGYANVFNGGGYRSLISVKTKLDSGEIKAVE